MKTIFRILAILVVAALIGGAIYTAVSAAGSATTGGESGEFTGDRPPRPEGEFRPDGDRDGDFEGGLMLPFGAVKSLVLMGVIGIPYYFWRKKSVKTA
jgi:hypothetical protein